tara:strand:+ start:1024 stop:1614 length:591 start_codon:yes stop_codon:yes gene_type:complete
MPSAISYIGAMSVVNASGEITSQAIGDKALLTACADNTSIEVDATTGQLQLKDAGAGLSNGLQRNQASKYAGRWLRGALTASDAAGGIASLENTYGTTLIVTDVLVYVVTEAAGACTIDVGTGAAVAVYNNLIDGLLVGTSGGVAHTGVFSNLTDAGADGGIKQWGNTQFLNFSLQVGATAGLVGFYAVHVIDITS